MATPTFHKTHPYPQPYFDTTTTPNKTKILNKYLKSQPKSLQNIHPSHSLTTINTHTAKFLSDHLQYETIKIKSPFNRITKTNNFVLLINVSHQTNTTIHYNKTYTKIRKFFQNNNTLPITKIQLPNNSLIKHQLDYSSNYSTTFNTIEFPLHNQKLIQNFRFNKTTTYLIKKQDIIETTITLIEQQHDVLFCTHTNYHPYSLKQQHTLKKTT